MDKKQQRQINPIESMKQSTTQAVKPETGKSDKGSMCDDMCRCKSPVDPVVATANSQVVTLAEMFTECSKMWIEVADDVQAADPEMARRSLARADTFRFCAGKLLGD